MLPRRQSTDLKKDKELKQGREKRMKFNGRHGYVVSDSIKDECAVNIVGKGGDSANEKHCNLLRKEKVEIATVA